MIPPVIALLQLALSALLGGVFVAAALPKLRHPKGFLLTVLEYRVLPDGLRPIYARLAPPLELLAALLLFAGVGVRAAAALLALLALSFVIGVGANLARGRDLDCGCFGHEAGKDTSKTRQISLGVLLQDVGLLAAALALLATTRQWVELAPWSLARLSNAPAASVLLLLACVVATVAATIMLERAGPSRGRWRAGQLATIARVGQR
jgi:uncharacterized membrane protein YphA (DoxX/SURF4 family)